MNNEDKILQILAELQAGQNELRANYAELRTGQDELRTGQDELRANYAELRSGQDELRADIKRLNRNVANIEVEHGKKLDALHDGYQDVNRKVDAVKATVDEMAVTVAALDVLHDIQPHN